MLGLPGASYLYQGEELGLPEHTSIAPEHRQDPTFARTGGARVGRDGCRVPLPWEEGQPSNGFSSAAGWLPQPSSYAGLSRKSQEGRAGSTLELYRAALKLRKELALGEGSFDWVEQGDVLSYQNGKLTISHNFGFQQKEIQGTILLRSGSQDGPLQPNETVWTS
jgi:alpha-glucosidase